MLQVEAVFFDCDGTLADSEIICPHACVMMFREFGIHVDLEEVLTRFRGVKLYGVTDIIGEEQGVMMTQADVGHIYRAEVARPFDTEFGDIVGANELLASINVLMCAASNGLANKMQRLLGKLNMLHYFSEKLFDGYDIQCWKSGPVLMLHAVKAMSVNVENCTLIGGSSTGTQSRIDVGMEVSYFCADLHNRPIAYLKVTTFTHLS